MKTLLILLTAHAVVGTLVLQDTPPKGWNSFDLQWDKLNWNETVFRQSAQALVDQGFAKAGYDTIVIDGGWSGPHLNIDEYGRPIPNPDAWPSSRGGKGFAPLATWAHSLGLKIGIWRIRGAPQSAVDRDTKVLGTNYTMNDVIWHEGACPSLWCVCTWDKTYIGLDASHPGSQAYYNSMVDLYAEWGIDLLKWDCLYESNAGAYSSEETLVVNAVRQASRDMVLSLSPGGGMTDNGASWIASGSRATMYRVTGDFHAVDINQMLGNVFVVGNMTQFIGANKTWPDLDMIDLGKDSPYYNTPQASLHAVLWMMSRSALMFAGAVPADKTTIDLMTNPLALGINERSSGLQVRYQGRCDCTPHDTNQHSCIPTNPVASEPCVATWWSNLPDSSCRAVAVLNIGNFTTSYSADFSSFGLKKDSYTVTNVYEHHSASSSSLQLSLPAESAAMFVISTSDAQSCFQG